MPLPAHELLNPLCPIKPGWAVFDRAWYLRNHAEARSICAGKPEEAALMYYLRAGARLGHSPSPLFDERFYLSRNVDVAELVRAGNYNSGFDHFCRHGHRGLSPHWLFDDALYADLYEDMSLDNLDAHRCYGRYDHYLKSGQREKRMAQFLFDGGFYKAGAVAAGVAEAEIDALGPYVHYLYRLGAAGAELAPSIYFEPSWYLEQSTGAKSCVERGLFRGAIHHYLCSETPEHLDPAPQFSEQYYRLSYPDIAAAIDNGFYRSGYQQFIQQGAFELRRPRADIDLVYYRDMNDRVRDDLNRGDVRDAFAHLRAVGLKENLPYSPPEPAPLLTEPTAKQLFQLKARNNLAGLARRRLDFTCAGPAALSVVMVLFNKFALTMLALASLRDNFAGGIELILVDNDSADDTRRISDYVLGARVLRQTRNLGFLRAANLALEHVTAPALLFLNNDLELAHGAIAAALARLGGSETIGAVGGKIIRANGQLQEAGSIIWQDGTTTGYLRDASPLAPEANYVRDVDYCSAVFLLCRTALVHKLGGFDEAFSPAYYEDADLCIRVAEAGYRIVYDPSVIIHHLEFGSAAYTEASMALMRRGRRIFRRKHESFLKTKWPPGPPNEIRARAVNGRRKRVLFIEDTVPIRRLGSGFVRSNDIVHAIAAAGHDVDLFPINGAPHDVMSLFGDMPEGAEVLHDRSIMVLDKFLEERRDYYDLLWVCRTHNLGRILPLLDAAGIDPATTPVILDTEAVVARREAARHALQGEDFDLPAALQTEFAEAGICRQITAVNQAEVECLQQLGLPATLLGTMREAAPTPAPFAARDGLLLIAAIHQPDSPNYDALLWTMNALLPALAAEFDTPPMLHVAGYTTPLIDMTPFENHPNITLHGSLGDLRAIYNQCRVFIAPARFAAGTPYKVYETAAYGLPCVATTLLAEQIGWSDGAELLTAPGGDAARFAAQIARLYNGKPLWTAIRAQALKRLQTDHAPAPFNQTVADLLRGALYGSDAQRFSAVS